MHKSIVLFFLSSLLLSACCEDHPITIFDFFPDPPIAECDNSQATAIASRTITDGQLLSTQVNDGSKVLLTYSTGLYWADLNLDKILQKIESPVAARAFRNSDAVYLQGDLAVAASSTGLAVFNVKTGTVQWERTIGDCDFQSGVVGLGDQFFVTRRLVEADGVTADAVFTGNLRNPEQLDLLCTPSYSRAEHAWAGYGRITSIAPFAGEDGHAYLLLSYFETEQALGKDNYFLALYDLSSQIWVYERRPPAPVTKSYSASLGRPIQIAGTEAYMTWEHKILVWDIVAGKVLQTLESPLTSNLDQGFWKVIQVNAQYLIAEGDNNLQVWEPVSHSKLYSIYPLGNGTVRAEFDLDRLFITGTDGITVYEISTGKKLESIVAPCTKFLSTTAVWKDTYGAIHIAVSAGDGNISHYVLQH